MDGAPPPPSPPAEAHLSRQVEWIGGTLLDAVRAVLARGTPKLVCYGAVEALPELLSLGKSGGVLAEQETGNPRCCLHHYFPAVLAECRLPATNRVLPPHILLCRLEAGRPAGGSAGGGGAAVAGCRRRGPRQAGAQEAAGGCGAKLQGAAPARPCAPMLSMLTAATTAA
jgi:hypothetical protein